MSLTETTIADAIVTLMRGPSGTGNADHALAATVAVNVRPALMKAFGARVPSDLTGDTTFKTLISNHISTTINADDAAQRQMLLRAIQHGNVHSADYSAALTAAARGPLGADFAARLAAIVAHGEGRSAGTLERTLGLSNGYYTANNLSPALRLHIDGPRASPAQVAAAANYASSIGLDPSRYAGHFVGTSQVAQQAIAAHIRSGAAVTDQHITNPNDARAVIAAIQAGKMKPEDAPPSVQAIMADMRSKGVDPASASARDIGGYFQQNPKALEAARAANTAALATQRHLTDDQRTDQMRIARAPDTQPKTNTVAVPAPSPQVGKLNV